MLSEFSQYINSQWTPIFAMLLGALVLSRLLGRRLHRFLPGKRLMNAATPPARLVAVVTPQAAPTGSEVASLAAAWMAKGTRSAERVLSEAYRPDPRTFARDLRIALGVEGKSGHRDAVALIQWGQQAARAGDRIIAHRLFLEALEIDPGHEEGWLWLAGTCEQPEQAIHCLQFVLERNPDNTRASRGLSDLLRRVGAI